MIVAAGDSKRGSYTVASADVQGYTNAAGAWQGLF
jgi:hypothetical protein